jgi:hypothetical protein
VFISQAERRVVLTVIVGNSHEELNEVPVFGFCTGFLCLRHRAGGAGYKNQYA